eukprot:2795605-Pleurochrysis_carterae.AAC.1
MPTEASHVPPRRTWAQLRRTARPERSAPSSMAPEKSACLKSDLNRFAWFATRFERPGDPQR